VSALSRMAATPEEGLKVEGKPLKCPAPDLWFNPIMHALLFPGGQNLPRPGPGLLHPMGAAPGGHAAAARSGAAACAAQPVPGPRTQGHCAECGGLNYERQRL